VPRSPSNSGMRLSGLAVVIDELFKKIQTGASSYSQKC
jgi:hypothetical protein